MSIWEERYPSHSPGQLFPRSRRAFQPIRDSKRKVRSIWGIVGIFPFTRAVVPPQQKGFSALLLLLIRLVLPQAHRQVLHDSLQVSGVPEPLDQDLPEGSFIDPSPDQGKVPPLFACG